MSIWWVNLGQRFAAQVAAKALWCPNRTIRKGGSLGNPQWHWSTIEGVKPGEFIVLCRDGYIEGMAIANGAAAADQPKPNGFPSGDKWHDKGWLLQISICLFAKKRSRAEMTNGLFGEKVKYRALHNDPVTGKGTGAEIYFARVRDADGIPLFERIASVLDREKPGWLNEAVGLAKTIENANDISSHETMRMALVKARVGQGQFRNSLFGVWAGKCCATGLDVDRLLVASHIHPWSLSNNDERLDPNNGLLLSAAYDAAFDEGLITIDENGDWKVVANLSDAQLHQAGLGRLLEQSVEGLTDRHHAYLSRHRLRAEEKAARK